MPAMRLLPAPRALGVRCAWACVWAAMSGCAGDADSPLLDPDAIGSDQGTLVSIGDVRTVAAEMLGSMNQSSALTALRAAGRPLRIQVGRFKQRTSIAIFDRRIFLNSLLSSLTAADAEGRYVFIAPPGALPAAPAETPAAAGDVDLTLEGELRELLDRDPTPGGGLLERRTVQYTLKLLRVRDGSVAWARSHEIVKQQVLGAVYR